MWNTKVQPKLVVGSIATVLLVSTLFMYGSLSLYQRYAEKQLEAESVEGGILRHHRTNYFNDVAIEAQAAFVYDMSTKKILFQKNATVPLPLASITKTMTAIVAEEEAAKDDRKIVTIHRSALDTDGESGLVENEQWDLKKLLSFMLINSSNDGAAAVAEAFSDPEESFVDKMNKKAKELDLSSMSFKNPTGLDFETENDTGGYGSARDVASLIEYAVIHHPDIFESTTNAEKYFSSYSFSHEATNTNTALNEIPNSIASKTGFTLKAGGNLAMVFDRGLNEPVVLVVLGSTYDGRFTDIETLASSTLKTYNQTQ